MPTANNIHLAMSPVLVAEMKAVAGAEGRTLVEVAQSAVERFLEDRHWQELAGYGRDQVARLGLAHDDGQRLIAESRLGH